MASTPHLPNDRAAREVMTRFLGNADFTIRRYPTGLCHFVYEITKPDDSKVVLRMGHNDTRAHLEGSVYWTKRLVPLGVPLPRILHVDLSGRLPYTIISHIPGTDLGEVLPSLSPALTRKIAHQVAEIQENAQQLPYGTGFGYGFSPSDNRLLPSWRSFIDQQIEKARAAIVTNGICNPAHVDRVRRELKPLESYLASILPTPFLDDTTTKNVLVDSSGVVGIVDVDAVCYGDPVYVLALTSMAIRSSGWSTEYINYWSKAWNLSERQLNALSFYTAIMCIGFMGEMGMQFNKESVAIDPKRVVHLEKILTELVGS